MITDSPVPPPAGGRSGHGTDSILDYLRQATQGETWPELRIATSDGGDIPLQELIPALLAIVRKTLGMDVVFVSEFVGGTRVFRHVDVPADSPVIAVGQATPLESSWCKRVVDGRLSSFIADAGPLQARGEAEPTPFPIGTHLSVPILLADGTAAGTVCCFSFAAKADATAADLDMLRAIAAFIAASTQRRASRRS